MTEKKYRAPSNVECGSKTSALLQAENISLADFGSRLSMTKDGVWQRLSARRGVWDIEWLVRLANALGIPIGLLTEYLCSNETWKKFKGEEEQDDKARE